MGATLDMIDLSAGTRQGERLAPPLAEGFLQVEDRDLAARLVLLADLARQITFIDPEGRVAGTWDKLFHGDPVFHLAELADMSVEDAEQRFVAALSQDWRAATEEVARLARRVAAWLDRLGALPDSPFRQKIAALHAMDDTLGKLQVLAAPQGALDMAALRRIAPPEALDEATPRDPVAAARADLARLRDAHGTLLNVVTALRPAAARALAERVRARDIDPGLGLLIAELRVTDLVAERLNTLPEDLIRFYYEDILGQSRRGMPPERLLFALPPPANPVHLPRGATIEGRSGERIWTFETETPVPVIPARVVGQAMLRYDTDPRISLFTSFAGITGIRAEALTGEALPKGRKVFAPSPVRPVEIGVEIASPMLWLAEGRREIRIELDLERRAAIEADDQTRVSLADLELVLRDDPELVRAMGFDDLAEGVGIITARVAARAAADGAPVSIALLHETLAHDVLTVAGLRVLLGRIVTTILIERQPWPAGAFWRMLRAKVARAGADLSGQRVVEAGRAPQSLIAEAFRQRPDGAGFVYDLDDVFDMLLGGAFAVTLSTAAGPLTPAICRVRRNAAGRPYGITFQIKLDPDDPTLTPPEGHSAPMVRIVASPEARICPVSFFERFTLSKIQIEVEADGLKQLSGFNDDGRLDLAQSFPPFGPRPADGMRFVVAAPEMALKPVSDVRIAIDWADLPGQGAGFEAHYRGYDPRLDRPEPVLAASYLSADGWKPLAPAPVAMFDAAPEGARLSENWTFEGEVLGNSIPDRAAAPPPAATSRSQLTAGAVCFTLGGTAKGFLAEAYPPALIKAMRPRLVDLRRRPVPKAPFVPQVRALRLGYSARKVIAANAPDSARPGERVTQITPFGRRTVFPRNAAGEIGLFPTRLGYGAHFVQIDGAGALGAVALLFEMAESAHARLAGPTIPLAWFYLAPAGWQRLPDTALASDTTNGLMRSGVVTVDLPDDACPLSDEMPGRGYWLAAVAERPDIGGFPMLRRVQTNGVWAVCADGPDTAPDTARRFGFAPARTGLAAPAEVARDRPPQAPEGVDAFKTRMAERLHHRQRAITPWDVERLVLEAFPEVWMVTCLPRFDTGHGRATPGHLTVVVVPHAPRVAPGATVYGRLFDPLFLRRVEAYLTARAPAEARVRVRNPGYEILQLRGRVRFDTGRAEGVLAQQLRQDMARHLTVWSAPEGLGRFGWSLNIGALHAAIEALPYVDRLTEFSVLHLVRDDGGDHALHDTAIHDPGAKGEARLSAAEPWGLPLSAADHILTSTQDTTPRAAQPTGIGGLRVGDMLIVKQGGDR